MIQNQQSMIFSPYMAIYDLVVPKDNLLRKINDLVDFSKVKHGITRCHGNFYGESKTNIEINRRKIRGKLPLNYKRRLKIHIFEF